MIYDFSKIICRIYPISIYIKMQDYKFVLCEKAKHNAKFYGDTAESLIGSVWVDSGYNAEVLLNVVSRFITF